MMLSRLEEEKDGDANGNAPARNSLKDRFKLLRMREEAGIIAVPGEDDKNGDTTTALGLVSPGGDGKQLEAPTTPSVPDADETLAPGTMVGVNAGPSAMPEAQVDWDLWQSVVYEGPAAVARTSAEELNRAIATGIPSAIRGVIWQVLAQSKNDDLEAVYNNLLGKGTEKEKNRNSNSTTASSVSNGGQSGDAVLSSSSSIHSEQSIANSTSSRKAEKNTDAVLKAQAAAAAEKKKRDKEDAIALQKLEKTIRRDLGARTSYSKYAASAGLQEGLFGVCKAYALFDEGVGYAQGMNFLIMPLLFNVCPRNVC